MVLTCPHNPQPHMIHALPSHIKKFRLGIYTSDITQPISLMRALGPFSDMAREDSRLEIVLPPLELSDPQNGKPGGQRLNWDWLAQCDAVFFLHPETDVHVHSLALAWKMGIPIWAEYVDDIFHVSTSNPVWKSRSNRKQLQENVRSVCAWASVVTCVSDINRKAILDGLECDTTRIENKFLVIPEACMWNQNHAPRKKCVSWRGLGSHAGDIDDALPHLVNASKAFPEWTWMFSGDQEIVEELGRNVAPICGPEKVLLAPLWPTPFDMMSAWESQAPYLHVVPLANNAFNLSKSHLAWLEATAIGAATIVPDHLPEWQQPGTIPYHDTKLITNGGNTLSDVLIREMSSFNEGKLHPNVDISRNAIYPKLGLRFMNQRRWSVLSRMCRPEPVEQLISEPVNA